MSSKTTITLFATTDLNFDQRLQRIASSLQNDGFEVKLVGRELKKSPPIIAANFQQVRFKCFFNKGVLFYLEFNFRSFIYLLKHKTDIATANDLDTVLGVYSGAWFSKKSRLVFDAHEYFTEVPELSKRGFKKKIWSWVEKTFVPKFDAHYTVNKSLAHIFEEKLAVNFAVVRNITVLQKNKNVYQKKEDRFILYQGALNKGRGLEALIAAVPKLKYPLVLAGDGDVKTELEKQVQNLKLGSKVVFKGKISPKELRKLTTKAYIAVNLLENNSLNYYYSLANKFFDYAHAEIPQVGMNFPEYKILNKQYEVSVLIKNLDEAAIVNAFKKLDNENFYKELKSNCKALKKEYHWHNEELSLLALYRKLKSPK